MAVEGVFGASTAWVSDIDPGANKILAHHWPGTTNIGDLTTARWEDVEPVDILCGGYPCQPFSIAGERKGTADARHLWPYISDALRVLRPRIAVFENVANHLRLGFDTVLTDLADLGFDAEWIVVRADRTVGAPHQRRRLFFLATAQDPDSAARGQRRLTAPGQAEGGQAWADAGRRGGVAAADSAGVGRGEGRPEPAGVEGGLGAPGGGTPDWGRFAPAIARWEAVTGRPAPWATDVRGRLSTPFVEWMMGLPAGHVTAVPELTRNEQLKALGNGVVPQQAAAALRVLADRAMPSWTVAA
jgi:DNA (cytosine-5)-methyltransferase 1